MAFNTTVIKKDYLPEGFDTTTKEGTEQAITALCVLIASQAKLFSPVDSGILRASIMWKANGQSGGKTGGKDLTEQAGKLEGIVGTATEYGIYQEFGTRYMAPNPFLRPAVAKYTTGQTDETIAKKIIIEHMNGKLRKGRNDTVFSM